MWHVSSHSGVTTLQTAIHLLLPYLLTVTYYLSWWRSTVVERRSLAGELSLSCARPAADG